MTDTATDLDTVLRDSSTHIRIHEAMNHKKRDFAASLLTVRLENVLAGHAEDCDGDPDRIDTDFAAAVHTLACCTYGPRLQMEMPAAVERELVRLTNILGYTFD